MLKKILALVAMLHALACSAADVNRASAAELDAIKGIGPSLSDRILDERRNGDFKDWSDLMSRVKGIGQRSAARFSGQGLTVGEAAYQDAAATPTGKKTKRTNRAETVKATASAAKP